jgi:hemerythrin superfamily protein
MDRSAPRAAHGSMKATTLLERQHRNLQQLCEAVERGSAKIRESLLPQLAGDLAAHIAVEEQVFYPAAREVLHEEVWLRSGRDSHFQAMESLDRVLHADVEGQEFAQAMSALRDVVELHAEEQEELLFPRFDASLDAGRMRELTRSMLALYRAKVEAGYGGASASSPP